MTQKPVDNEPPVPRILLPIGDPRRDNAGVFHLRATWNSVAGTLNMWEKVTTQIKDEKIWERYPPDNAYGSYDNLLKQEIGYTLAESMSEFKRRRDAQIQAHQTVPLHEHGTNQHKEETGVDNCKVLKGGNNPEYLTARIARDRPDILERMKAGEFKSVRAAAIEAGIVKVKPKNKISIDANDPDRAAEAIITAKGTDYINRLISALKRRMAA